LDHRLPFDSLGGLRQALFAAHPHLMRIGQIEPGEGKDIGKLGELNGNIDKAAFGSAVTDFYLTNPITRASAIMAECSALAHAAARTAAE
jgi:NADH-quinone oxidoreductase subunit G